MTKQEKMKSYLARKRKELAKKKEKAYIGMLEDNIQYPYKRMLTGILTFDYLLQGIIKGSMYEICGMANAGKSSLVFKILEKAPYIYPGFLCYYNDIEGTSKDLDFINRYPLLKWNSVILDCETKIETFFDTLLEMSDMVDLMCIDTVSALSSKNNVELEKAEMGKVAGLFTRGWRMFYDAARDGARVIALNQVRDKMNPYATNEGPVTPGGNAYKHALTGKIEIKRDGGQSRAEKGKDIFGNEKVIGWDTIIKVWKNKQGPFGKSITTFLHTDDSGENQYDTFDETRELIAFSKVYQLILTTGSMNSIIDPETGEESQKIKGAEALQNYIKENPEVAAKLKIYCYRNMFDNNHFYCLYDKILMIARADIQMRMIRNQLDFNKPIQVQLKSIDVDGEAILEKLKEEYPITKFFSPEALKNLEKEFGEPWLWALKEESEETDEEIA